MRVRWVRSGEQVLYGTGNSVAGPGFDENDGKGGKLHLAHLAAKCATGVVPDARATLRSGRSPGSGARDVEDAGAELDSCGCQRGPGDVTYDCIGAWGQTAEARGMTSVVGAEGSNCGPPTCQAVCGSGRARGSRVPEVLQTDTAADRYPVRLARRR